MHAFTHCAVQVYERPDFSDVEHSTLTAALPARRPESHATVPPRSVTTTRYALIGTDGPGGAGGATNEKEGRDTAVTTMSGATCASIKSTRKSTAGGSSDT
jgi:hypothetical protein